MSQHRHIDSICRVAFSAMAFVALVLFMALFFMPHGNAMDKREERAATVAKNIRFYQASRAEGILEWNNYLPGAAWDADLTIIDQVKECHPEIIPYLGKELLARKIETREAACFFLSEIFGDKASLTELVDYSLKNDGGFSTEIFGIFGYSFTEPISIELIDIGRDAKTNKRVFFKYKTKYIERWLAKYGSNLIDTEFGLGLTMPDGKIRPIRENGAVVFSDFRNRNMLAGWEPLTTHWFLSDKSDLVVLDDGAIIKVWRDLRLILPKPEHMPEEYKKSWDSFVELRFKELFADNLNKYPSYWPYYSVVGVYKGISRVLGYFDSEHRPHGPWHKYGDRYEITSTKWYVHGKESTEEEYVRSGGYDFSSTVPLTADEAAMMDKYITENMR